MSGSSGTRQDLNYWDRFRNEQQMHTADKRDGGGTSSQWDNHRSGSDVNSDSLVPDMTTAQTSSTDQRSSTARRFNPEMDRRDTGSMIFPRRSHSPSVIDAYESVGHVFDPWASGSADVAKSPRATTQLPVPSGQETRLQSLWSRQDDSTLRGHKIVNVQCNTNANADNEVTSLAIRMQSMRTSDGGERKQRHQKTSPSPDDRTSQAGFQFQKSISSPQWSLAAITSTSVSSDKSSNPPWSLRPQQHHQSMGGGENSILLPHRTAPLWADEEKSSVTYDEPVSGYGRDNQYPSNRSSGVNSIDSATPASTLNPITFPEAISKTRWSEDRGPLYLPSTSHTVSSQAHSSTYRAQPNHTNRSNSGQAEAATISSIGGNRSRQNKSVVEVFKSGLPVEPARSPWAMWTGNVPADATTEELLRFFSSRPGPERERAGGISGPGLDSIHLIGRSSCAFVNYQSERHLLHAVAVCNGRPLRPKDGRCKPLLCRVRMRGDDAKSGVGAQRGGGLHKAWIAAEVAASTLIKASKLAHTGSPLITPSKELSLGATDSDSSTSTTSSLFIANFPKRYFILKSHDIAYLEASVVSGLWRTQVHNEPFINQAFRTASEGVFFVFSANKSGEWFGYARMTDLISEEDDSLPRSPSLEHGGITFKTDLRTSKTGDNDFSRSGPSWGKAFPIEWIKVNPVAFVRTRYVLNGFNGGREVKISRDGTEIEPAAAERLLAEFWLSQPSLFSPTKVFRRHAGANRLDKAAVNGKGLLQRA